MSKRGSIQNLEVVEGILARLERPEGPTTVTLDLEGVEGLYEVCVKAVKKTNEHL